MQSQEARSHLDFSDSLVYEEDDSAQCGWGSTDHQTDINPQQGTWLTIIPFATEIFFYRKYKVQWRILWVTTQNHGKTTTALMTMGDG